MRTNCTKDLWDQFLPDFFPSHPEVIGAETGAVCAHFVEISCKIYDINSFTLRYMGQRSNNGLMV